jgi:glycine cleavage system T protein
LGVKSIELFFLQFNPIKERGYEMKITPLYEQHKRDGGKIVEFAGYLMPIQFTNIIQEHNQVRTKVGVFDVSHMGEIFVEGIEAIRFLDYLLTNHVALMKDGSCLYTMMCYENGTTVDDLIVYKYNDTKFLLVINASNDEKDYRWIKEKSSPFQVSITSLSHFYGEVAIQGPDSERLLTTLLGKELSEIEFFMFTEVMYKDIPLIISRTGYTGEDGFEVFIPWDKTETFYLDLFKVPEVDLKPIGLGARDTLRFEASLPLYGHELSDSINPVEARLNKFIAFDKGGFIGREALWITYQDSNPRCLVGFMLDEKGIAREGYDVFNEHKESIGQVTTGYSLESYERSIGLCMIPKKYSQLGSKIYIQIRKNLVPATIIKRNFYQKKYKK